MPELTDARGTPSYRFWEQVYIDPDINRRFYAAAPFFLPVLRYRTEDGDLRSQSNTLYLRTRPVNLLTSALYPRRVQL